MRNPKSSAYATQKHNAWRIHRSAKREGGKYYQIQNKSSAQSGSAEGGKIPNPKPSSFFGFVPHEVSPDEILRDPAKGGRNWDLFGSIGSI